VSLKFGFGISYLVVYDAGAARVHGRCMKVFPCNFRLPHCLLLLLLMCLLFVPVTVVAASVNDPYVSQQWGWRRVKGDLAYDAGYSGEGVVVALLDTGVDVSHPDLAENLMEGWNFVDNNGNVTDVDGHGTMVAGIVAAAANNGIGVAGVASNVTIMPLKVISESGGSLIDINLAIRYAADNGADVIGMSLGGTLTKGSIAMETAVNYAYQKGCVLVAAAGNNDTTEPFYPAAYENVIAVSAINETDQKASFSNYGDYIDFCAPGVNIVTTGKDGGYVSGSGTSFAAPFVTGVVAVMLSKYPSLSNGNVTETLRAQAEDLGEEGWDPFYGWGLVDAYDAGSLPPVPETSSTILFIAVTSATIMIFALKKTRDPAKLEKNTATP